MIASWNDLALDWARWYGAALLQNTLFLALVLAALHLLRDAPARLRQRIARVGLLKLLLPPLLVLPHTGGALVRGGGVAGEFAPLVFGGPPPAVLAAGGTPERPGLLALALAVWAAGALCWLAAAILCTWRLSRRLQPSVPVPDAELPPTLPRRIAVHRAERISIPLTLGVWPRCIYVPAAWDDWSPSSRALAIAHEYRHLQRRDGIWQTLQLLARALYFYHPLVWRLDRELDEIREMAVDDETAGTGRAAGLTYARLLMDLADSLAYGDESCRSASALCGRRRELRNRIRYQLDKGETMKTPTLKSIVVTAALLALIVPTSWRVGAAETEVAAAEAAPAQTAQFAVQATLAEPVAGTPTELKIVIRSDDEVGLQGTAMSVAEFDRKLADSGLAASDDVVYTIVCEEGVTLGDLYFVSAILRRTTAQPKVRFVNAEHEVSPLVLPPAHFAEKLAALAPEDRATVFVDADGVVTYADKPVPAAAVGQYAAKHAQQNPRLVVALSGDMATSYVAFVAVLEQLQRAGIDRIALLPPAGAPELSLGAPAP